MSASQGWLRFSSTVFIMVLLLTILAKSDQYVTRRESVALAWIIGSVFWACASVVYWIGVFVGRKENRPE